MNDEFTFGKYAGKTFEWVFFKAPWYAEWIYDNDIHRQRHHFSEQAGNHFEELFIRASQLSGGCRWCRQRPITRMGLSFQRGSGALGNVSFYCDGCEYLGGSPTDYVQPSFFADGYTMPRCEQLRITDKIKNVFIGGYERLTQQRMEQFFHTDANFIDATPGFFARKPTLVAK